jgi:hypothetical protein
VKSKFTWQGETSSELRFDRDTDYVGPTLEVRRLQCASFFETLSSEASLLRIKMGGVTATNNVLQAGVRCEPGRCWKSVL